MTTWKLPPRAKIYEALTAVADGRVRRVGECAADVVSSGGDRTYTVEWSADGAQIGANDNASYWQGYLGYPIIAVLMMRGVVRWDVDVAGQLAGIDWHTLNLRYKRKYEAAVDHVLRDLEARGVARDTVAREVEAIMAQLAALELERRGRGSRPPRG